MIENKYEYYNIFLKELERQRKINANYTVCNFPVCHFDYLTIWQNNNSGI